VEYNTVDLNDSITKKLDDNAALEPLVRQAVAKAMDKVCDLHT
jgi:DNA-binding protein YbaB